MATDVTRDAERTRARILAEAMAEFADQGYGSARVDEIAARTATTKRMIYYYFGSKEGLFAAVLDHAIVNTEFASLPQPDASGALDPVAAVRWLVQATFDRDEQYPDRIRLLSIASVHGTRYLSDRQPLDAPRLERIEWLRAVLERGASQGDFRAGVDPIDVITVVTAMSTFRVTHPPSMRALWDVDLLDPDVARRQQELVADMVLAYLRP